MSLNDTLIIRHLNTCCFSNIHPWNSAFYQKTLGYSSTVILVFFVGSRLYRRIINERQKLTKRNFQGFPFLLKQTCKGSSFWLLVNVPSRLKINQIFSNIKKIALFFFCFLDNSFFTQKKQKKRWKSTEQQTRLMSVVIAVSSYERRISWLEIHSPNH